MPVTHHSLLKAGSHQVLGVFYKTELGRSEGTLV